MNIFAEEENESLDARKSFQRQVANTLTVPSTMQPPVQRNARVRRRAYEVRAWASRVHQVAPHMCIYTYGTYVPLNRLTSFRFDVSRRNFERYFGLACRG